MCMRDVDHITNMYFLGIGGIGMSALARYFYTRGVHVSGYDKTPSAMTRALQSEGIVVSHSDDPACLAAEPELVVRTPAVPTSTKLYRHFQKHGVPIMKRAEVLGILSASLPTIAIAGTHGKTTICATLTHILKTAGIPCISFLGGISTNYNTNYIGEPNPRWLVAEADEYDRSFLHLSPQLALITSIDPDHLDVYGNKEGLLESFSLFAKRLPPGGTLITGKGIEGMVSHQGKQLQYHPEAPADYYMGKIAVHDGLYHTSFHGKLEIGHVRSGHPGRHNLENALAAAALAHQAGVPAYTIKSALKSFRGVKRRFEICLQTENTVYIDDYAHHPEEISRCIASAREMWPGKKITGVFQPHLYSRTKDLAGDFAESLAQLDELILLDIYPARETPIEGVDAHMLLKKINMDHAAHCPRNELLDRLNARKTEVLISMGAGDIDRFAEPITQLLKNKALK